MFRSSSIIRELALNLVKVIFMLKHSVKLVVIYYAVVWQHVMEWRAPRRAEDFYLPLKIRRLRPGLNQRTWVPKASTLPLDHRSLDIEP